MHSFPYWKPVRCSMSCSNCWFVTCIQICQEAGEVMRYSHLFQNFPHFVVIHIVKGSSIVNEAEVDVFLKFPCFLYDPANVDNLISDSSSFSKPSLNIWKFSVKMFYCYFLDYLFIYLFILAALVLRCCMWTFFCCRAHTCLLHDRV